MNAEEMRKKLQGGGELDNIEACIGFAHKVAPNTAEEAAKELEEMRQALKDAKAVIESVEWGGKFDGWSCCPMCLEIGAHKNDCTLFNELQKLDRINQRD